ncbi:MAG: carbohydrate kinase [Methyloglobulus sp.]|nr:carbohydrate kinase [Methyloglobulus sp.]
MQNNAITVFGEVLFDHFPDGTKVLGGAPFNVAWHLQAFGQQPQFISRVGADTDGNQIQTAMQLWGMNLGFLQQDSTYPTGRVQVAIQHGEPSYAILPDQAYDHIEMQGLNSISPIGILCHGTLAVRSAVSRKTLAALKTLHQGKIFVDVNLRQPWWNKAEVLRSFNDADWLKLNLQELRELKDDVTDIRASMEELLYRYKLKGIIITCGKEGALAMNNAGEFCSVSPTALVGLIDTVGAGDAFSAILLLGLNLGWTLGQSMERAQLFASTITGQRGATVNDLNFYQPFISSWQSE